MKNFIYISVVFLFCYCAPKPEKREEVLRKDIAKAIVIIEEKNNQRLKKLKSYHDNDTANNEMKKLYFSFLSIHKFKEEYKKAVNGNTDIVIASKIFIESCLGQLTQKEQKIVKESLKDSFITDEEFLELNKNESMMKLELQLEVEMLVQELDRLLVKDLKAVNRTFDWEIFWE